MTDPAEREKYKFILNRVEPDVLFLSTSIILMERQLTNPGKEQRTIFVSEKDREKFFDAIMNPAGPNKKLCDAAERYKLFIEEKK